MFRRRIPFDFVYSLLQIATLQAFFYFGMLTFIFLWDMAGRIPFTTGQFLHYAMYDTKSPAGRASIAGTLAGGIVAAMVFSHTEGRHRKALDSIATTFGIHIAITSVLGVFPKGVTWWFSFTVGLVLSAFTARFLSLRIEMQVIDPIKAMNSHKSSELL